MWALFPLFAAGEAVVLALLGDQVNDLLGSEHVDGYLQENLVAANVAS